MFGNLYDALRSAGADEAKARQAAEEMASSLATVDAVNDLKADLGAVKKDVGQLKSDVAVLRWIGGLTLALVIAVIGLLLRASH